MKAKLINLLLMLVASVGTMYAESGTCGANLTWSLNTEDSTLTIEGSGDMFISGMSAPWKANASYVKSAILPDGLTSIGKYAFYECENLQSISIPSSVKNIGGAAFMDCKKLQSIVIPNGITRIEANTFDRCYKLENVIIPNTVTSIGMEAFSHCEALNNIYIPSSVTKMERRAFKWCGISSVHITDIAAWCAISFENDDSNPLDGAKHLFIGDDEITDLVIPEGVTSISEFAFHCAYGLKSVSFSNTVTSIGADAFRGTNIENLTLENNIESIGDRAFYLCSYLTNIALPESVTYLGKEVFFGCGFVTSITCRAVTPPTCGDNPFTDKHKSLPLYVPVESVEAYKTADVWKEFTNIKPLIELVEDEVIIEFLNEKSEKLHSETVKLQKPVAPAINGFTFVKWQVVAGDFEDGITIQAVYEANDPTSAPSVYTNPSNPAQKLIRNGNVYILTDDSRTYTLTGQEVK